MTLNDPFTIFILMAVFGGVGYMIKLILDKLIFERIKRNEDAHEQLRKDFEDQGKHLEGKIVQSNNEILGAIKEQSDSMVHTNDCKSTQALLREQRESWIKIQKIQSKADAKAHLDIIGTIKGLTDHIEKLSNCINELQKKKDCKP